MWDTRQRELLGLAAAIAAIVVGLGIGLLPSQLATAQVGGPGPAGGDRLFDICLFQPPDRADLAFSRADCDIAAEGSYQAGVFRPFIGRIDGKMRLCKMPFQLWVCVGVPSVAAGPNRP